jgi:hypothetical protein
VEDHISFFFEHNLVVWENAELFDGSWDDANVILENNLYWRRDGEPIRFSGDRALEAWQATGKDRGSVVADPLFADLSAGDYRLEPGSPALDIGFRPFDWRRAGVYGDPEWVALAEDIEFPAVEFAPLPPPLPPVTIDEDFEGYPLGAPPLDVQVHTENHPALITVTDEIPAYSGRKCLAVRDTTGLQFGYNPHMVYAPNHTSGMTTARFALRPGPGSMLYHEWRDSSNPYRVGPSFRVEDGVVSVAGTPVCDIPLDEWTVIGVRAGLGELADGHWSLMIERFDGEQQVFEGLDCDPDWRELTWVGFVSDATTERIFFLDAVGIWNDQENAGERGGPDER